MAQQVKNKIKSLDTQAWWREFNNRDLWWEERTNSFKCSSHLHTRTVSTHPSKPHANKKQKVEKCKKLIPVGQTNSYKGENVMPFPHWKWIQEILDYPLHVSDLFNRLFALNSSCIGANCQGKPGKWFLPGGADWKSFWTTFLYKDSSLANSLAASKFTGFSRTGSESSI